jgi:hypothetical protein
MSSDLLAEFDSFYTAPSKGSSSVTKVAQASYVSSKPSAFDDFSFFEAPAVTATPATQPITQWAAPSSTLNDDLWGDFNSFVEKPKEPISLVAFDPWGSLGGSTGGQPSALNHSHLDADVKRTTLHGNSTQPEAAKIYDSDFFSNNIPQSTGSRTTPQSTNISSFSQKSLLGVPTHIRVKESNDDVLFDADDHVQEEEEEDDEFGDFESVQAPSAQPDLLESEAATIISITGKRPENLLTNPNTLKADPFPYPQAPKSPSFQERNPFVELALSTALHTPLATEDHPKTSTPVTAWPVYVPTVPKSDPYQDSPALKKVQDSDDDWGDFADFPPEAPTGKKLEGIEVDARGWDTVDNVATLPKSVTTSTTSVPPPTNVPPPSVLLSVFPQLFNLPQSTLFTAMANQPFALKNRIISDPSTISFLRGYILLATVAARVIAGRKLRWKRDTHLSQAMKIGPAAAGGKGGMKLTGIDKAEVAREDREAADLVRIWGDQVGRLRSAIATANSSLKDHSTHLAVPEIKEAMAVKNQGGLAAPKACVICGLKREERIAKVDLQVEDSFGEWWVEHWGHKACKNFWDEHESTLKQR